MLKWCLACCYFTTLRTNRNIILFQGIKLSGYLTSNIQFIWWWYLMLILMSLKIGEMRARKSRWKKYQVSIDADVSGYNLLVWIIFVLSRTRNCVYAQLSPNFGLFSLTDMQVIFAGEKIQDITSLSTNAVLILGQGNFLLFVSKFLQTLCCCMWKNWSMLHAIIACVLKIMLQMELPCLLFWVPVVFDWLPNTILFFKVLSGYSKKDPKCTTNLDLV